MKRILLTICTSFFLFTGYSQRHFIYLESDNQQPFYIKINIAGSEPSNKIISSNAPGYLIVSRLRDTTYHLIVGFIKNQYPEQNFTIPVRSNSAYQLKNFGERGWGLFNLQTLEVIKTDTLAIGDSLALSGKIGMETKVTAFIDMLADAVNDSTLRNPDLQLQNRGPMVFDFSDLLTTTDEDSIANYTQILKKSESINPNGVERLYVDSAADNTDSIKVFIPIPLANDSATANVLNKSVDSTIAIIKTDSSAISSQKVDSLANSVSTIKITDSTSIAVSDSMKMTPAVTLINSDCKSQATDDDFFKLRRKMVAENTEDDMVKSAKKYFKNKCFTTLYIKNLSVLFLTDEGKFAFFDAAYPFTSDAQNFAMLEKEITDINYVNRFRAMVKKN